MRHHFVIYTLVLTGYLATAGASRAAADSVYPGRTWATKTPAEVGMDVEKLKALSTLVGGRGCVVRRGYLVYRWGDVSRRGDVASAAKPFYSFFLFKAIEDGKIQSVDEKVVKWEPRLKQINKRLGYKDRRIAWRHLANQTSCYQLVERPGTAFAYNDWQMALFWDTLFLKVYGATYSTVDEEVFHPLLTDRLGCEDRPTLMAFGPGDRPGRVAVSVRDFARFGLLYLRKGNWKGKQLISQKHATMAVSSPLSNSIPRAGSKPAEMIPGQRTIGSAAKPDNQTDHFGSYSWLWWTNGVDRNRTRMFPDAPEDTYGAFGHGGPRAIWVIPSLEIVVSYNDAQLHRWTSGRSNPTNEAMKLLVEACAAKPNEARRTGAFFPPPQSGPESKIRFAAYRRLRSSAAVEGFAKWSRIEFTFPGPDSQGRGDPNPFAVRLDVVFTGPDGRQYRVPGFYDGDGMGGLDGNLWKVRFSADREGQWAYQTESPHSRLDGKTGRFLVTAAGPNAKGFWKRGRLEYPGTPQNGIRYLKFRDGPYWLKAGCDDPENFLGKCKNYDDLAKRKAAVDYLAARGVNSMYILTHNIGGDDRDVWPWLGGTEAEAKTNAGKHARFDVGKLEEWRKLFEHMQARGVVPYLILEDDSAWKGYDHRSYYRELIARFGYLPALILNLGEEHNENYRLPEALAWMQRLKQIDPFDHPHGIHNVNLPSNEYVDAPQVDFTSIQTGSPGTRRGLQRALEHNQMAIDWINLCRLRKRRVLMVGFDEGRPEQHRAGWWSAYMAGGVWEVHVREPYDRPFSAWEPAWIELGGARAFLETMPFWEMEPNNTLVKSGQAFCLAKPGHAYALYLPSGGRVTIDLAPATYEYAWWNPDNGRDGSFQNSGRAAGGTQQFTAPRSGDWALRIIRKGS